MLKSSNITYDKNLETSISSYVNNNTNINKLLNVVTNHDIDFIFITCSKNDNISLLTSIFKNKTGKYQVDSSKFIRFTVSMIRYYIANEKKIDDIYIKDDINYNMPIIINIRDPFEASIYRYFEKKYGDFSKMTKFEYDSINIYEDIEYIKSIDFINEMDYKYYGFKRILYDIFQYNDINILKKYNKLIIIKFEDSIDDKIKKLSTIFKDFSIFEQYKNYNVDLPISTFIAKNITVDKKVLEVIYNNKDISWMFENDFFYNQNDKKNFIEKWSNYREFINYSTSDLKSPLINHYNYFTFLSDNYKLFNGDIESIRNNYKKCYYISNIDSFVIETTFLNLINTL